MAFRAERIPKLKRGRVEADLLKVVNGRRVTRNTGAPVRELEFAGGAGAGRQMRVGLR